MRTILAAALVAAFFASPASAFTRTSTFTWNGVRTVCTYTTPYGMNCYTTGIGTGNTARVINVPQEQAPREPEMSEAERAAARRATCASRSVVCLPEPAW
jgi:hypothetical protein